LALLTYEALGRRQILVKQPQLTQPLSTPVTSGDVARHAKVSQSAVSRAFTPGASISAKMREKILKSAVELGYRPNALARAMISGRSGLIAMLVAYLDNQFYPLMLEQISRRLQETGYQVLLFMTDPGDQDEVVSRILQYQVEGIVMASATLSSELATECARTGIPVVLFNRYVSTLPASSVISDNIEGGRMIARYLVEGGHERIAFMAGAEDSSTNRDREAGFYQGLAECGHTVFERVVGGYSFERAAEAAHQLFGKPDRPDAIFVANDHMAFSVMDVIRHDLGLRIPEDVSVIGYDDVPQAAWKAYDLTTVSQAGSQMIEATTKMLLEQIETAAVRKRAAVFPAELVVRSSARIPPG
jgi:DNA-binding LacI/PurR family transcriptional regulator